ncbi:ABC-2 type transport system permease protein [Paenibacillus shirakamiensis]|uniref:ABC-2 type transport system permease protein n=1 Tax=Paenibacillus shirakamiensis TaxID=1265935 RepID=A0ABS4JFP8_9BACL|nr:ABC-2 family transporter protein [Paenibacillus shirakamiensis]MBP1999951.1 ABC-2 type transport system permease protein [Paenibacillus shirakamiensis]
MFHTMRIARKYMTLYGIFIKNCLIAQMEFRGNFIMSLLVESVYLLAKLLYVLVVFRTDLHVNGIPPEGLLLFIGMHTVATGMYVGLFFTNFMKIPEYIKDGSLDLMLTKPVSLQFMASLRYVDLALPIPDIVVGFVMISIGWNAMDIPLTFLHFAGFVLLLVVSIVITYCLMIIPALLSFWFVQTGSLFEMAHSVWDANNFPMAIYPAWIRRIGTFVVPLFLITNFGPMFLLGQLSWLYAAMALIGSLLLFVAIRLLWKQAVKGYSSASS